MAAPTGGGDGGGGRGLYLGLTLDMHMQVTTDKDGRVRQLVWANQPAHMFGKRGGACFDVCKDTVDRSGYNCY